MGSKTTIRRRWLGAFALAAALAMLVAGQTLLQGQLSDLTFLFYWLGCVVLTGLALLTALLDVRALRERTRQEQHDLFANTLKEIQTQARNKNNRSGSGNS